ncbi:hypothetical protein PV05_11169 [Exophiala xenobiotica]|uniref:Transcription factor domain-containing protein n=1 Tax=Exophiala xenobiotica TaxID=348802 RepID=A0A0D2BBH5_9EURO|nr:uncharacterized protein PV05_11169 [Exophiala xenobiotica]KIW49496.1 hypothetical protein PV05_11169 [Exophiala xenobiotica]
MPDNAESESPESDSPSRSRSSKTISSSYQATRVQEISKRHIQPAIRSSPSLIYQPNSPLGSAGCATILLNIDVRRVHHYATTVLWPGFGHHILSTNETLTSAFFRLSVTDELLLNSFVWTAALEMSLHHDSSPGSGPRNNNKANAVMLSCQNKAVKSVREHIDAGTVTDAVIFAVLALTISETDPTIVAHNQDRHKCCFGGFDPGFRSLGWLDYFSYFRWAETHISALKRLVAARGGLDNITTPGIAEQVQSTDILQSSLTMTRPNFALGPLYRHVLEHQVKMVRPPRERAAVFGGVDDDLKDLLLDMRMYCCLIQSSSDERHVQNLATSWETNVYRNLIQFQLLSLPTMQGEAELCRLAALAFSYGVIYPLACHGPLESLVKQLKGVFEDDTTSISKPSEFLLWVAVMGAMAASHTRDDVFFIDMLKMQLKRREVASFDQLKKVMSKFLWLGAACDRGARRPWKQVCNVNESSFETGLRR